MENVKLSHHMNFMSKFILKDQWEARQKFSSFCVNEFVICRYSVILLRLLTFRILYQVLIDCFILQTVNLSVLIFLIKPDNVLCGTKNGTKKFCSLSNFYTFGSNNDKRRFIKQDLLYSIRSCLSELIINDFETLRNYLIL